MIHVRGGKKRLKAKLYSHRISYLFCAKHKLEQLWNSLACPRKLKYDPTLRLYASITRRAPEALFVQLSFNKGVTLKNQFSASQAAFFYFYFSPPEDFFFIEFRERGREREKHLHKREASIGWLPYVPRLGVSLGGHRHPCPEDWTHSLGMCSDLESNPLPFGDGTTLQPTEPLWPGLQAAFCFLTK